MPHYDNDPQANDVEATLPDPYDEPSSQDGATADVDVQPHASDVELTDDSHDTATSTVHVPGSKLETKDDAEAREDFESAERADTRPNEHVIEYQPGSTSSPEAQVLTRSNIVSGGPGTAGHDVVKAAVRDGDDPAEKLAEAAGLPVDDDALETVQVADPRDYVRYETEDDNDPPAYQ